MSVRHLIPGACLLLALLPSAAAQSFAAFELPNSGDGARAEALDLFPQGFDGFAVGSLEMPDGRDVPTAWNLDLLASTAVADPLPLEAGARGTATGVCTAPGSADVSGTVTTADGLEHARLWRTNGQSGWTPRALPDVGFGSRARGIMIDFTQAGFDSLVAGDVTTVTGRRVPAVWHVTAGGIRPIPLRLPPTIHGSAKGILVDNDIVASYGAAWIDDAAPVPVAWSIDLATGKSALSVLSLPAGFRGRARGIVRSPQGIVFVVGRATSPNGTDFAVAWRSTGPGSWAVTPLSAAGSDSAAHGVAIDSAGDGRSIGQRDDAQERSVPVHWTIDLATGDTTPTALPVPASVDGAAMAIAMDPSGRSVIVGTTTDASGFDRAALWRETGP